MFTVYHIYLFTYFSLSELELEEGQRYPRLCNPSTSLNLKIYLIYALLLLSVLCALEYDTFCILR